MKNVKDNNAYRIKVDCDAIALVNGLLEYTDYRSPEQMRLMGILYPFAIAQQVGLTCDELCNLIRINWDLFQRNVISVDIGQR